MREAATTWALVVGIDAYDAFPPLQGAARDAAATVRWLRRLGVPDEQVLLHAAPCDAARPDLDALGRTWLGCTEPEIWGSFDRLWQEQGSRLFVFLSGHGFYEPSGARVFLTQEANQRALKNLGIDWYAALLRGFAFDRQFLVMDGCLNLPYTASERARFKPGQQSAVELPPPRLGVQQYLCTAAAPGERALEDAGRGLFTSALLTMLDLDSRCVDCTDIDETTGAYRLDLRTAVDAVRRQVADRAAAVGRVQQPVFQPLHDGYSPAVVPVAEVVPDGTSDVQLRVRPEAALPAVREVVVFSTDSSWLRRWPVPPEERRLRLPVGVPVTVLCKVQKDAAWTEPAQQSFLTLDSGNVIEVRLEAPAATEDFTVRIATVGPSGDGVSGMENCDAYAHVNDVLSGTEVPVRMDTHETGPVLRGAWADSVALGELALRVGSVIDHHTDDAVHTVIRGLDTRGVRTLVRVVAPSPRTLAGLLQDEPTVHVGEHRLSVAACAEGAELEVPPGPVTVRVDLPWGTWRSRPVCRPGATTDVALPASVGLPPLRVLLLDDASGEVGPRSSLVLADGSPEPHLLGRPLTGHRRRTAWAGEVSLARPTGSGVAGAYPAPDDVVTVGAYSLPLNPVGPVAVLPTATPRAEPLSLLPLPLWDRLVTGRPGPVDPGQVPTGQPILALMAAYADLEAGRLEAVDVLLDRLAVEAPFLPDVAVLRAAAGYAQGIDALTWLHDAPVLRRGVTLAALAARDHGLDEAADRWQALERRLVAESVWTLWTD